MNLVTVEQTKARTIDEVIHALDEIIEWAKQNKSRVGYFAALYRKVTVQVKNGIAENFFDDGPRMERLDVIFANRFLDAFAQYRAVIEPTLSWQLAFEVSQYRRPIVLQHLLIGMNAHIQLDLGIAAAETVTPGKLSALKGDFYKINNILASLINEIQLELSQVWPLLRLIDYAAGEADEALARFGMNVARGQAWKVAESLSALPAEERVLKIKELDQTVVKMGRRIYNPGYFLRLILLLIRVGEIRSVHRIIQILE
jgi:hypothetical protein